MSLPRMRVVNGDELTLLIDGQVHYLYDIHGHEELNLYAHRAQMSEREMAALIREHLQPILVQVRAMEKAFASEHGVSADAAKHSGHAKYDAWMDLLETRYGDLYLNAREYAMASAGFVAINSTVGFFSMPTSDNADQADEHLARVERGER